jgi:hypothetical protein
MSMSEAADLRQNIELEYEAMQRAMTAFAEGTARHAFITARMDGVGHYQQALAVHIGKEAAGKFVFERYLAAVGEETIPE